jgi:hypothetical protein
VKQNGCSLLFASKELQNNKEVVLEAVKQNGCSLLFASKELQEFKKIVLVAVKQNGSSLKYSSEQLRNDKEVEWKSKGYFQWIKLIKKFDLNFKFSN